MLKRNLIVFFLLGLILILHAMPAFPGKIDFKQPDNTIIKIQLFGDEKIRFAESEDGYTLLFNDSGYYEYARLNSNNDLIPSGVTAKAIQLRTESERQFIRTLDKHLRYNESQVNMMLSIYQIRENEASRSFPPLGNRKLIMILIGFTDKAFTKTQADFNNLMNQANYSVNGAFGSVKDWFLANSFNQLTLTTDIAGPFTASQNVAYYGANSNGGDIRPRELVTEAVNLANPTVNFAEYDNDNDGSVDGVYIIYAGFGEEAGGGANCIWAHAWNISPLVLDNKTISKYSCSAELSGSSGTTITNIGVICHEFSHVCGLPDFYDTDYSGSGGQSFDLGDWDPMASGSWNDNGKRPPFHNAYSRAFLGWQTQITLETGTQLSLENSSIQTTTYRYNTPTTNEYFVVENRQQTSWDYYIPYHGMLIYHVDKNWSGWNGNSINATPSHQGMDIEEADNTQSSSSTSGDPFPGITNKTSFTDTSSPNSKTWANANTGKPISNIVENNGVISFDFMGGDVSNPTQFSANSTSLTSIDLAWTSANGYPNVIIAVNSSNTFGLPVDGQAYSLGQSINGGGQVIYSGTANVFQHTDLTSGTSYYYKIWAVYGNSEYSVGRTANANTLLAPLTLPYTQNFNGSTATPIGWQITDNQGSEQIWQIGSLTAGLVNSGNYAYVDSDGFGNGGVQNTDLITPLFDLTNFTSVNLQFKHYFRSYSGSSGKLYYTIDNGQNWVLIQTWSADTTNPMIFNQAVNAVAGNNAVKFKWTYQGSYAWYWCVDDINITGIDNTPVSADFSANNTISYVNTPVIFTSACTGTINNYSWNFGEGAIPQTATTVGPHTVSYSSLGFKTVSLTVNSTITETKASYINIIPDNNPQNLTAIAGNAQVLLNWQAPEVRELVSYKIYRNNAFLVSVPANSLAYTDTNVINGTEYSYYVKALYTNPDIESNASNIVTVTPLAPVLPSPEGLIGQIDHLSILLNWGMENPLSIISSKIGLRKYPINSQIDRNLLNFKVYRDQLLIATLPATDFSYLDLSPDFGTHSYYITAVYTEGESNPSNIMEIEFNNPNLFPATVLSASSMANHVTLNWNFANSLRWLHHDNGILDTVIGSANPFSFIVASRFSTLYLEGLGLVGKKISKIRFKIGSLSPEYTLMVWRGGNINTLNSGELVYSQEVNPTIEGQWSEFTLNDSIEILEGQEIWIGYQAVGENCGAAGMDSGTMSDFNGNLLFIEDEWTSAHAIDPSFNGNWVLQALVDLETYPIVLDSRDNGKLPYLNSGSDREIDVLGYRVKRDNQILTSTILADTVNTYFDGNVPDGFHTYQVYAVYEDEDSEPVSDTISINTITISQYPYFDSFEGSIYLRDWITLNLDNDSRSWMQLDSAPNSHTGQFCMISESYLVDLGAITPDNWLITPRLVLPQVETGHNLLVSYWVACLGPNNPIEHYALKLSNSGSLPENFNISLLDEDVNTNVWMQKTVNLNAYAGQTVFIALRHYNVTGQYALRIDDFKISDPVSNSETTLVEVTGLGKNYPNPFNPTTTIEYSVKSKADVRLEIYNAKGQKVKTLVNSSHNSGLYRVEWDGKDENNKAISSGVYFCRMKAGSVSDTSKLMLIK